MKRSPMPRSRRPVNPRSQQRTDELPERRALVERLLSEYPRCQARPLLRQGLFDAEEVGADDDAAIYRRALDACWRRSSVLHEPKRRSRGGDYLNPLHCMATCQPCNAWVENHDRLAEACGLLIPSHIGDGDWRANLERLRADKC